MLPRNLTKGFTLWEVLVVIIILGFLFVGFLVFDVSQNNVELRKEKALWEQHIEDVKDKIFIIEIDGKEYDVVVRGVKE